MIAALGRLIAREERVRLGKRGKSDPIFQLWFGEFNKPFKPARTAFDWLSRDEKEVDAFVADPLCGFPFTTQLAIDVLDALPYVTSRKSLAAIRRDMAVYVFSGERDPVGANIKGLIQDLRRKLPNLHQVDGELLELDLTDLDLRQIEQVVQDLEQCLSGGLYGEGVPCLTGG